MIRKDNILKRLGNCRNISRLDDDFFVIGICASDFPAAPVINHMYQCSICLRGSCRSRVNLKMVESSAGSVSFSVPGQIIEILAISDDYEATLISISPEFIASLGFTNSLNIANILNSNPVVRLSDKENEAILMFSEMVRKILERPRPHVCEILQHMTSAMIYSMADSVISRIPPSLSREESITQNYLTAVSRNYHVKRKVTEYASDMNITPGYLSTVVKKVTGKSAAEWIDEYVIMEAKALLASTDMTIQQICYQLNFPSQSFFGKYFKAHAGISPRSFRLNIFKEN